MPAAAREPAATEPAATEPAVMEPEARPVRTAPADFQATPTQALARTRARVAVIRTVRRAAARVRAVPRTPAERRTRAGRPAPEVRPMRAVRPTRAAPRVAAAARSSLPPLARSTEISASPARTVARPSAIALHTPVQRARPP